MQFTRHRRGFFFVAPFVFPAVLRLGLAEHSTFASVVVVDVAFGFGFGFGFDFAFTEAVFAFAIFGATSTHAGSGSVSPCLWHFARQNKARPTSSAFHSTPNSFAYY